MHLSMSSPTRPKPIRHIAWLVTVLTLLSFALVDIAIVAWCAKVISAPEIAAGALAFGLLSSGAIATVWKLDR